MVLAFVMFVVGVGLVLGGYALVAHVPGMLEQRRLSQRLSDLSAAPERPESDASLVKKTPKGPMPAMDRLVAGTKTGSWLTTLIEQAGVQTTPSAIVLMTVVFAALGWLLATVLVRVPILPAVAGAIGAAAPIGFLKIKRAARMKKFEEQFPEALDLLSRALRAGHAFQTAMGMVADDLKEPVGPEFRKTFDEQNFGLPLRDALFQFSDRVPLMDVRFFVTAVLIQRETGGNLAEILDNLAHVVRQRFKIRRQIRTHTAHGRFTGFVLMALPAALAVILAMINPEHMDLLFKHRTGQTLIVTAIVMQTIGFFWIRKILRIEV